MLFVIIVLIFYIIIKRHMFKSYFMVIARFFNHSFALKTDNSSGYFEENISNYLQNPIVSCLKKCTKHKKAAKVTLEKKVLENKKRFVSAKAKTFEEIELEEL